MTISTHTAIVAYILIDRYDAGMIFIGSVVLLFVFIAGTLSRIQRRRAKARRQNAAAYNALVDFHQQAARRHFELDLQPAEDAGERDMYGRRVQ